MRLTRKRTIPTPYRRFESGVERITHAVTENVERDRRNEQGQSREHQEPPRLLVHVLRLGDHLAPVGGRRRDAQTKKRQAGLEHDSDGDQQRGIDDQLGQDIGQHVDEHDSP